MGGRGSAGGKGSSIGVARAQQREITIDGKTYNVAEERKKLQDYESSLDSRFKKYEVGEATIYKVGSNYAVYDLKRIPRNRNVTNTLADTASTLKQATTIAEKLSELIKKDKRGTKIR